MVSRPRLFGRTRVKKASASLLSSPKLNVLVLLDTEADSKIILYLLKKRTYTLSSNPVIKHRFS
jgi:hypothetical protein